MLQWKAEQLERDLDDVTRGLGVEPNLKEVPAEGLRYTIWEEENGGKFSWNPRA